MLKGIREIKRGEYGRVLNVPSVSTIRESTGLTQSQFAKLLWCFGTNAAGVGAGRRAPSGAARTLLLIAAKNPRALRDVA